jgi:hypothetical protein
VMATTLPSIPDMISSPSTRSVINWGSPHLRERLSGRASV